MGLKFTYKDFKELGQYCKSFIGGSLPYNLLLDRFKTLSLGILLHIEGEIRWGNSTQKHICKTYHI
jgi:hypothetical protein